MVAWILIIVVLVAFQILGFAFSFPKVYIDISTILVLVAALGMLYRYYSKRKVNLRETAEKKKYNAILSEVLKTEGGCTASDILAAVNRQLEGDRRRIDEILIAEGKIIRSQLEIMMEIEKQEE